MGRRPARAAPNDAGVSLVEISVAGLLISVVLGLVLVAFISMQRAWLQSAERHSNLSEAQVTMDNLSKDIRTATRLEAGTSPFELANANEMQVYANLNATAGPRLLHIYVTDDRELAIDTTEADGGGSGCTTHDDNPPSTQIVGTDVANSSGTPLFTYLDGDGDELATPVSASDMLQIEAVEIDLRVTPADNADVAETQLINRVRLPNVGFEPPEADC